MPAEKLYWQHAQDDRTLVRVEFPAHAVTVERRHWIYQKLGPHQGLHLEMRPDSASDKPCIAYEVYQRREPFWAAVFRDYRECVRLFEELGIQQPDGFGASRGTLAHALHVG